MLVLLILVLEAGMLMGFDGFPFACVASLFYYRCYIIITYVLAIRKPPKTIKLSLLLKPIIKLIKIIIILLCWIS